MSGKKFAVVATDLFKGKVMKIRLFKDESSASDYLNSDVEKFIEVKRRKGYDYHGKFEVCCTTTGVTTFTVVTYIVKGVRRNFAWELVEIRQGWERAKERTLDNEEVTEAYEQVEQENVTTNEKKEDEKATEICSETPEQVEVEPLVEPKKKKKEREA